MNRRRFLATGLPAMLVAQTPPPAPSPSPELQPAPAATRTAALQALRVQPDVSAQLQMIQDEGAVVDIANARVLTGRAGTVTVIPLRPAAGERPVHSQMIVERSADGAAPFVYYLGGEGNTPPKPARLFGCSGWGPWRQDGSPYCKQTIYLCLVKQQSTFIRYVRYKDCKNTTKKDYKVVRQHCGC